MIKTVRITYEGRTYEVTTNSDKINEPLCCYCQVRRVRKDGKPGQNITTIDIIFAVLRASEA